MLCGFVLTVLGGFSLLSSSLCAKIVEQSGNKRWEVTDPKLKEAQMVINKLVDESIANRVREAQKEVEDLLEKNIAKHVAETGKTLFSDELTEDPECQDKLDTCAVLAKSGVCKTSSKAMYDHCRKTCKLCTPRISIAPHLKLVFDPKTMQLLANEATISNDQKSSTKESKKGKNHKQQFSIHLDKNIKPSFDWQKILAQVKGASKVHVSAMKPQVEWVKYIPLKGENGKKGPILKISKKAHPKLQYDKHIHHVTHKVHPKHKVIKKPKKTSKSKPKKTHHWVDPLEDYYKSLCHPLCHINCISSCAPGCCKLGPGPKKPTHHITKFVTSSKCHPMCKTTCLSSCGAGCCTSNEEKKKKQSDEKKRKEKCHPMCFDECLPSCPSDCCSERAKELLEKSKALHDAHCHPQCKEMCLESCGPGCCSESDEKKRAEKLENLDAEDDEPPPEGDAVPGRCPAACPSICAPTCDVNCCKGITTSSLTAQPDELALQQQALEQQQLGQTCPLGCYDLCSAGCPASCCQPGQSPQTAASVDPYAANQMVVDPATMQSMMPVQPVQPAQQPTCPGECANSCAPDCSYACCATTNPSSPFPATPSKVFHVTHLLTPPAQQQLGSECFECDSHCTPSCARRGCCFFD